MECVMVCITQQLRWLGGWLSIHTGLAGLFVLVTCMWPICTGVLCMYVYIVEGCGWGDGVG